MTNTTRPKLRVSCIESDIGYCNHTIIKDIFLNGERLLNCITADEELGEVLHFKGYGVDEETLKGKVEITFREGFDHTNLIFFNKGQ